MCLGIPGKLVEIADEARMLGVADITGVRRKVNLACVAPEDGPLDTLIGEWALIHVGFAMSIIDAREAEATLAALAGLGEAQAELDAICASSAMLENTS